MLLKNLRQSQPDGVTPALPILRPEKRRTNAASDHIIVTQLFALGGIRVEPCSKSSNETVSALTTRQIREPRIDKL